MKRLLALLALLPVPPLLLADPPKEVMNIVRASDMVLKASPRVPGISQVVLEGDPAVPGKVYVVRNRFAPGTFSPPHFHPETRYIVVLKGTWWVGSGPKFDKEATTPVPAGGFVVHHPNQIHWDGAKDEEAVVQITGIGPGTTILVDEAGRPKK
ncbi:MAG TPA: cupin domain-containing protein [Burkholderiales bacterium]|nr:cupin domain-containing protein [Burkholderiales bacterium]